MSEDAVSERKRVEVERVFAALRRGDFEAVGRLLDQIPEGEKLSNFCHPKYGTVFHAVLSSRKVCPNALTQRLIAVVDFDWCVKQRNSWGSSLLHSFYFNRDDNQALEMARMILEVDPELIYCKDKYGMTPLHCSSPASHPNLISFLLSQPGAKEALAMQDDYGDTPLYSACIDRSVPPDILEALITKFPSALQMQARNTGHMPLHRAACVNINVPAIESLISHFPDALQLTTFIGWTPLHCACEGSDVGVIETLIRSLPEALEMMDNEGMTPLASACRWQRDHDILEALFEAYPAALSMPDSAGRLPIHHAAAPNLHWHAFGYNPIEFLVIRGGRGILGTQDSDGQTPLHMACCISYEGLYAYHLELIQLLVAMYPRALQIRDMNGDRPIDLFKNSIHSVNCGVNQEKDAMIAEAAMALMNNLPDSPSLHSCLRHPECSPNLARFFIDAFQDQVSTVDQHGNLPIHIVASMPLSADDSQFLRETMELLLSLHPNACRIPNRQGDLPLTLMARSGKDWASGMDLVFLEHPPALLDLPRLNGRALCELLRKTARDGKPTGLFCLLKDIPSLL